MELPLFPLHAVLFPGRSLPLHVFEPRYRTMLAEALSRDRRFGVVAIREGHEVDGDADPFAVGTVAMVEDVTTLEDGRYDLVVRGAQRFRIEELLPPSPYPRGTVRLLHDAPCDSSAALAAMLRRELTPYLACLGAPGELLERLPDEPVELSFLAAAALQVDLSTQQRLLELEPAERIGATLRLLRREQRLIRHLGAVGSLRPPGPIGPQLN